MKRIYFAVLAVFALLCFSSCSKSSDNNNNGNPGGGQGDNAGPLFTSVRTVLQSNCAVAGCHSGASPQNGLDFSSNATIIAQKDRIKVRAVDNAGTPAQMPPPPRPSLSAADQKRITDWIAGGGRLTD